SNQRNVSRPIRVVFNLSDTPGHTFLIALKIDDAIEPFVTAAATSHGYPSVVITTRNSLLRFQQRLLRYRAERQLVARQVSLIAPRSGCRCKFLDSHLVRCPLSVVRCSGLVPLTTDY